MRKELEDIVMAWSNIQKNLENDYDSVSNSCEIAQAYILDEILGELRRLLDNTN